MFSTQVIVSQFVHIFDIISVFPAKFVEPKLAYQVKG